MNFRESEAYLYSLGNEVFAMKLGLENIRKLLAALGNPQKNYLKVQVAGTNGKGSVCAFLDSICRAAGIRTGMTTSPHLISVTERVKIDGEDITQEGFAALATRVRQVSEDLVNRGDLETVPTYFEQVTAIALLAFVEANVELAILETGLGGRLDATTAADAEIAAITRIDLDHQQYLGDTIGEIAAEKAAIIHEYSAVAVGAQPKEAIRVIADRCAQFGITPVTGTESNDWKIAVDEAGKVKLDTHRAIYREVKLGLEGRHQIENAQVALSVAQILKYAFGIAIDDENLIVGLEKAVHQGRLECIGKFLLDGAHNVNAARALRAYLDEFVPHPIALVFGAMRDKDVGRIASILFPKAASLILTAPANSRALSPDDLVRFVPAALPRERLSVCRTAADAVSKAVALSPPEGIIVVTGSLYLVGEVRELLSRDAEAKI